jgi:hypothetical protein
VKLNKRIIDRAVRHLGVQIQHERGSGYFYFTTLGEDAHQVGESVYVCYYDQLTLQQWESEAELAVRFETQNPNF